MKILNSILGIFKGGGIKTIAIVVVLAACVGFGWSYSNRGHKIEKQKAEIKKQKVDIDELSGISKRTANELGLSLLEIDRLHVKRKDDSVNFDRRVVEFQLLIRKLTDRQKADSEYIKKLESGIYCWEKNMWGKRKLVECPDK